jgi:ABC-type multidrug transport system ATPase subunit/ABC-type multidrug transport system permease subunit
MSVIINVHQVSKSFISQSGTHKVIKALDDVSLQVREGEILGILGPNGAGKTTFLNVLSTLLIPDAGSIEIMGIKSHPRNFRTLRTLFNMSSGYPNFPWSLSVEENLRFYGRLYGLSGQKLLSKIDTLIEMFELNKFAKLRFDELSSGTKQRLALAKSLLNDPKIVFLDEPTVGLDPDVSIKTREVITHIMREKKVTVLLTTHNMQEAELMCQRIAFIRQGKILRLATPQQLKGQENKKDLEEVFVALANAPMIANGENAKVCAGETTTKVVAKIPQAPISERMMNWCQRCFAFTVRNLIFASRNVFAFVELVFWPVVSLISIGLMGDYLQLVDKALAFILTGAITAGVLQVAQLDVAYSLLYEVWSKSIKQTFLTPTGESEHLIGSWFIGIMRGIAIFVILGVSAALLFGFQFPSLMATAIFLLGIFGCALLLGMLVGILILLFGQKAEITAWMFAYVFMLICGIYYPINTLPPALFYIAQFLPVTYFLEYYRQSFGFEPLLSYGLLKGFGLIVIYFMLGLWAMRWAFYQARVKGILVRLSE